MTPSDLAAAKVRVAATLTRWADQNPGNDLIRGFLAGQALDESLCHSLISAALGRETLDIDDGTGLSFLAALASQRPIRRGPAGPWLYLGTDGHRRAWRRIDTGALEGLDPRDYEATDWEVMP